MPRSICTMHHAAAILTSLTCVCTSAAHAQDLFEPVDMLKDAPPEFYTPDIGSTALASLVWRVEQDERFSDRLHERLHNLSVSREMLDARAEELQNNLPIQFQFASDEIRARVVGRCLEELLAAQLDLATNSTLINELEATAALEEAAADEQQKKAMQLRMRALEQQLDLAHQERARLEALAKQGVVAQRELSDAALRITQAEADLMEVRLAADAEIQKRVSRVTDRLVDLRMESAALQARERAAQAFLERMSASTATERELELLRRRADVLDDQISELTMQRDLIEIRIDEARSLADLIRKRIEAQETSPDDEDQ